LFSLIIAGLISNPILRMLRFDLSVLYLSLNASLKAADIGPALDTVQIKGRIFYLLTVSYGRLPEGDDDVTVPLLSAIKGRRDEENLTGLPNPCSLSIGGDDPSYAYQILLKALHVFV
jgi:hypothetical protein